MTEGDRRLIRGWRLRAVGVPVGLLLDLHSLVLLLSRLLFIVTVIVIVVAIFFIASISISKFHLIPLHAIFFHLVAVGALDKIVTKHFLRLSALLLLIVIIVLLLFTVFIDNRKLGTDSVWEKIGEALAGTRKEVLLGKPRADRNQ